MYHIFILGATSRSQLRTPLAPPEKLACASRCYTAGAPLTRPCPHKQTTENSGRSRRRGRSSSASAPLATGLSSMVFAQMSSLTSGNARKRPSSSLPSSAAAAASADRGRVKRAKAAVARGADRAPAQWCKTCVRRLRNDPRHSCSNQAGT